MRVSKEQAEQNRQHVIETAARLFRQRGLDGIGLTELMQAAGLTHGGFYRQFESKEDLIVQAATRALQENETNRQDLLAGSQQPWEAFKHSYLSTAHCRHPEQGCAFTTLALEASRREGKLKAVLSSGLKAFLRNVETVIPPEPGIETREQAILALASMVGAVVLARVADDKAFAKEILESVEGLI